MARSKSGEGCAGCFALALLCGIAYGGWRVAGWHLIILVAVIVIVACLAIPTHCQICGNQLKRSSFKWKIDGRNRKVCRHCNERLERQQSRQAINRLGL